MYAILSVSNKSNIEYFARELVALNYKILSTGGTLEYLRKCDIDVEDISIFTAQEELFDGRVKTLHPRIHGGILFRRENPNDVMVAKNNGIVEILLVCVNLYPFVETTKKTSDFDEIIENIDIGGPSLIRAAAKNFKSVNIVVDSADYERVIAALKSGSDDIDFRRSLMIKAFEHTASYDSFIANYMNERFNGGFGEHYFIDGKKYSDMKYGENPHQKGALYEFDNAWSDSFHILKGESSFNNILDANIAIKIVKSFDKNAVCIIKHGNPCGFSSLDNVVESYTNALRCDNLSAYGGVVAINGMLDLSLANAMKDMFFEAIIANSVTREAMEVFSSKKRIRIFTIGDLKNDKLNFKYVNGGFLLQESDIILDDEVSSAKAMGKVTASKNQMRDLVIAYKLAAFTKSNCVTYVKDSSLVAIGMGLTSRVDACKLAVKKAQEMNLSLCGSVVASEAFFPFRDSIDLIAKEGVSAIIEPGGSIRDDEVIAASDEYNIAIYFTGKRHFLH